MSSVKIPLNEALLLVLYMVFLVSLPAFFAFLIMGSPNPGFQQVKQRLEHGQPLLVWPQDRIVGLVVDATQACGARLGAPDVVWGTLRIVGHDKTASYWQASTMRSTGCRETVFLDPTNWDNLVGIAQTLQERKRSVEEAVSPSMLKDAFGHQGSTP